MLKAFKVTVVSLIFVDAPFFALVYFLAGLGVTFGVWLRNHCWSGEYLYQQLVVVRIRRPFTRTVETEPKTASASTQCFDGGDNELNQDWCTLLCWVINSDTMHVLPLVHWWMTLGYPVRWYFLCNSSLLGAQGKSTYEHCALPPVQMSLGMNYSCQAAEIPMYYYSLSMSNKSNSRGDVSS